MGDLSNIKEVSRLNEDEAGSEVEFPQISAKRQRVSNDAKEQSDGERKKLLKMFEPFLEEKMSE